LQIPHCESAIASTFSQINGCAYGIDMHSKDARAEGETSNGFMCSDRGAKLRSFTDRERAALAWTEG